MFLSLAVCFVVVFRFFFFLVLFLFVFSSAEPSGTQTCIISSHAHSGLQNVVVAIFKIIGVESSEITISCLLYFPVDCLLERSLNLSSETSQCWGIVNGRTAREEVMIIGWNL